MLIKMTVSSDIHFLEETTIEITVNPDMIGAFLPMREQGPTSGTWYVVCYQVVFTADLAPMFGTMQFVCVDEKERIEKLLAPRGGLKPSAGM